MSEIFGWFAAENRTELERLIPELDIRSVLEIGSFLGLSAAWFAARVDSVTCVDKFEEVDTWESSNNLVATLRDLKLPNPFYHVFVKNMIDAGAWSKIKVLHGWSADMAAQAPEVDLVYVDGDHSYEGCWSDIKLYLPKARKLICGDDYTARFPGLKAAVTELLPGHRSVGAFWWYIK